jgi:hypothetical protein
LGQDIVTEKRIANWQERAQLFAFAGQKLILEDGPEIMNEENTEEDHGKETSTDLSPHPLQMEQTRRNFEGRSGGSGAISGCRLIDHAGNVRMIENAIRDHPSWQSRDMS